jgi:hypothetical protein
LDWKAEHLCSISAVRDHERAFNNFFKDGAYQATALGKNVGIARLTNSSGDACSSFPSLLLSEPGCCFPTL